MAVTKRAQFIVGAAVLGLVTAVSPASAQNVEDCTGVEIDITDSFVGGGGTGPGDDGSYEYAIPTSVFPDGIPFAGGLQTTLWVNINGNLSFEGPEPTFTPNAIPGLTQPTIAPYFTDIDLRDPNVLGVPVAENPGRVLICVESDAGRILFTWRNVVFFDSSVLGANLDKRLTFQAVLEILPGLCGEDDGLGVTFNYDRLDWYVGDASGGDDGVCPGGASIPDGCTPAVAGFDAGDGETAYALTGSRTAGVADALLALGTESYELRGGSVPECGNGTIDGTCEDCDDEGDSETCDMDCTFVECGDEYVNAVAGEECDDGTAEDNDICDSDCTFAECGDGYLNEVAAEECDDEGDSETCDMDCTFVECGDEYVNAEAGEECDDGNVDDDDGCSADCVIEIAEPEPDVVEEVEPDVVEDTELPDAGDIDAVEEEFELQGRFSGGACHSNSVADGRSAPPIGLLVGLLGMLAVRRRR